MPTFEEHISQAKKNLVFLENINARITNCNDWQVTVCFYSGVHLINAHITTINMQFRKHKDVENAINPFNKMAVAKLPLPVFLAYQQLQVLSRRSRYLVNLKDGNLTDNNAHFTNSKHFSKAMKHLDTLLIFFNEKYGISFEQVDLECIDFKQTSDIKYIKKRVSATS